ncbi:MAG TPA: hypothetical protein VGH42_06560 [Verrucomicrobiae bacterium]|jgi:hypothetical protein
MSLINDALKRARQSQQKNPPGGPPLFPVEIKTRGGIGWFLPTVIVALVVAAGIFIVMALARRTPPSPVAVAPEISVTQQIGSVSVPPSNPPAAVSTTNGASTNEAPISNSVPPPPPPPPEPKLQGIIYDPAKPWAIVNGKTVYVGDHVGDFRVKEITKNSVTLQNADGSEKTLVMGE